MAGYTDTELEAAVSRYVRGDVKTDRTDLGPLSTDYAFLEVREFVASTLVFDPRAVFYLLSLAANRVNQDVLQATEYLDDIITAIGEVGRDTTKVTQTSLLEDAAAALIEAERAINERGVLVQKPFERYDRVLASFTARSLEPNIRREVSSSPGSYEIVRTPQKAQSAIKASIIELRDLHTEVLSEVDQLTQAMSEFLDASLPLVSVQNSVPKIRRDLRDLKSAFDAATVDGAIEITREAFLSIQAGRSVATNLLTIEDPRSPRMASSSDTGDRASAATASVSSFPAEAETQNSAPYLITPSTNEVRLEVDGGAEQLVSLPVPERGYVVGSVGEDYDIHGDTAPFLLSSGLSPYAIPVSPDNLFSIYADGTGYEVALTSGSRTATQIAAEINGALRIDGDPGSFSSVGTASSAGGILLIRHDSVGGTALALGAAPVLAPLLGFTDEASSEGLLANNEIRFIVGHVADVVVGLTEGLRTASQISADISSSVYMEGSTEALETDAGPITVVRATAAAYGEGSHVSVASSTAVQERAVAVLGMFEGQNGRGDFLELTALEDALTAMSGLDFEQILLEIQGGSGGTAVLDGSYKLRLPLGTLSALVTAGNTLVISNGENFGNYRISSVSLGPSYDELEVSRALPAVTGDAALSQEWSVRNDVLAIKSGTQSTSSQLVVNAATANTTLGLVSGTYLGLLSGVRVYEGSTAVSFSRADVVAGDTLTLKGPIYETEHVVTEVTNDGAQVEVDPLVASDLSAHEYQVDSSGALAYDEFLVSLAEWYSEKLNSSKFSEDVLELERVLNPLLANRNPSSTLVGTADQTALVLSDIYSSLSGVLADFTTLRVPRIDAVLDMLQERGLDKAHDLLLLGEFEEFFAATKDGASYGGNLLEKMRAIAQNDVPQGRGVDQDNVDDRLTGSYEEADADFDFSDQDDESGELEVDDVPDLDAEEDVLNRSF